MKRVFAVVVLLCAPLCLAQQESAAQEPDRVRYKRVTVLNYEDVEVEGTLAGGGGVYEAIRPKAKFKSMVGIRANFERELHRSVDAL